MAVQQPLLGLDRDTLEIIAFTLHAQQFCVLTTTIREIRGWSPCMPVPHAPPGVLGVMNLRGSVIPIVDLARRLGMATTICNERSAIVVADVGTMVLGLVVDQVSDILTVRDSQIQPVPDMTASCERGFSDGVITHENGMICLLNLARMFHSADHTLDQGTRQNAATAAETPAATRGVATEADRSRQLPNQVNVGSGGSRHRGAGTPSPSQPAAPAVRQMATEVSRALTSNATLLHES